MKTLILYTQSMTIICATFITLVQERIIKLEDPYSEMIFVQVAVPVAICLMSLCIQVGYTSVF